MGLQTDLARLQNAKAALKTSIAAKGVTVPDAALLDGYAALVGQIQQGPASYTGTVTAGSGNAYQLCLRYVSSGAISAKTLGSGESATITVDAGSALALLQFSGAYTARNAALNFYTGHGGDNLGVALPTGDNFSVSSYYYSGGN